MMASAMMQEGSGGLGTVADLAPSLTMGLKDDMWRLEARGAESDVKKGEQIVHISSDPLFRVFFWLLSRI